MDPDKNQDRDRDPDKDPNKDQNRDPDKDPNRDPNDTDDKCVCCCVHFDEKHKSTRLSLNAAVVRGTDINITVSKALSSLFGIYCTPFKGRTNARYVCRNCFCAVSSAYTKRQALERRICKGSYVEVRSRKQVKDAGTSPMPAPPVPTKRPRMDSPHKKAPRRDSFLWKACSYFQDAKYMTGHRTLLKNSPKAVKAFRRIMAEQINEEIRRYGAKRPQSMLCREFSVENLKTFSWEKLIEETESLMPTLYTAFTAATMKLTVSHADILEELVPKLGAVIATSLYIRQPRKYNLATAAIGVDLLRGRCKQKTLNALNNLGFCQGHGTISSNVKKFEAQSTSQQSWDLQDFGGNAEGEEREAGENAEEMDVDAPVDERPAPLDGTPAPVDGTAGPEDEMPAPVDETPTTNVSLEEVDSQLNNGETESNPGVSGSDPGFPGSTPGFPRSTPGFPGSTPGFPGSTPGFPGSTPGFPGSTPGFPGSDPGFPGSTPGVPGSTPGVPVSDPGLVSTQPSLVDLESASLTQAACVVTQANPALSPGYSIVIEDHTYFEPSLSHSDSMDYFQLDLQ